MTRINIPRALWAWVSAFCILLFAVQSRANINITYNVNDFGFSTNLVKGITLTPIAAGFDYSGSTLLAVSEMRPSIFTNGTAIFSNKVSGYAYYVTFTGPAIQTARLTNYFFATDSGNISGIDRTAWIAGFDSNGRVSRVAFFSPTNFSSFAINSGTGTGIFARATAANLIFNSIAGAGAVSISSNNDTLTITSPALTNQQSTAIDFSNSISAPVMSPTVLQSPFIYGGSSDIVFSNNGYGTVLTLKAAQDTAIFHGVVDAQEFTGGAGSLTGLNADQLSTGKFPLGRVPSTVITNSGNVPLTSALIKGNGTYGASNAVANVDYATTNTATYDGPGLIDRSNYASVNVISGVSQAEFPLPIGRINLWYTAGASHNATLVSNAVDLLASQGYTARRIPYVMVTDGWQSNRLNGVLQFNTNYYGVATNYPWGTATVTNNITNLLAHARSKNAKLGIYTQPNTTTLAGYPGSLGFLEQDARMFAAMGFKYVQFDLIVDPSLKVFYVQEFARALRLTPQAQQEPIHLYSTQMGFDPNSPNEEVATALAAGTLNSFRTHGDPASCPDPGCAWTNNLSFMDRDTYALQYLPKGKYLEPEICSLVDAPYADSSKGYWLWNNFVPNNVSLNYPYGAADGFKGMQITNDNVIVTVWQDPLGEKCRVANSNATSQVFYRKLTEGKLAVFFQNRQMNNTNVGTLLWGQAQLITNAQYMLMDAWGGTNIAVVSNSITRMIGSNTADLYILTPFIPAPRMTNDQQFVYREYNSRELITDGSASGNGPGNSFNEDVISAAASAVLKVMLNVPQWATNMQVTYGVQSDQAMSWTNSFQGFLYGDNARSFGAVSNFNVTGGTTIKWQTNTMTLDTPGGSETSRLWRMNFETGTNTTGNRYLVCPVKLRFNTGL